MSHDQPALEAARGAVAAKATAREWFGLAVLTLPCLVLVMDFTVLHLAVPRLTAQMNPTASQLLWIVDIYGFLLSGSLVTMGNLGDRIGRRKLLMFGGAGFAAASLMAAFASSAPMLICARALLGVAGATIAPSTLALLSNMFRDEHERARAISIWGASFAAGGVIGLLAGGILLRYFDWGSVFLVNLPVMALLLLAGPRVLPEFRDPRPRAIDLASAVLSLSAVLSIIYGLKKIAENGFTSLPLLIAMAGLLLGIVFVRRQQTLEHPMVDVKLFRVPIFSATLIMFVLAGFVMYGISFYLAQYLQLVLGLQPLHAGLSSIPSTVAVVGSSLAAPALARRFDRISIMIASLLLTAVGFVMYTQAASFGLYYLIGSSIVLSLGMGPISIFSSVLIVESVPPERAGSAASLSETSAEFGGAVGLAVLGSIGVAVYRHTVAGALPLGIPPDLADAARRTLAEAVHVAGQLSGESGTALLAVARGAFMDSFVAVSAVCAVLMVGAAIMLSLVAMKTRSVDEPVHKT